MTAEPAECMAPHVGHSSGRCERWRGDPIHGPARECEAREGVPCLNPRAHHDFVDDDREFYAADFGAVGDGLADDTDAFQSFIDWHHRHRPSQTLDPGPGTYRITRTLEAKA